MAYFPLIATNRRGGRIQLHWFSAQQWVSRGGNQEWDLTDLALDPLPRASGSHLPLSFLPSSSYKTGRTQELSPSYDEEQMRTCV